VKYRQAKRLACYHRAEVTFVPVNRKSRWLGPCVLGPAASLLMACSRPPEPALGGLDGRYEGTLTMSYGSNSKTLGISMIFESNGAVTSHSELDEPQHSYYRLRDDHTAIDLYDKDKALYGHVQLTDLGPDRIKASSCPTTALVTWAPLT
jgi:hypothetical protein